MKLKKWPATISITNHAASQFLRRARVKNAEEAGRNIQENMQRLFNDKKNLLPPVGGAGHLEHIAILKIPIRKSLTSQEVTYGVIIENDYIDAESVYLVVTILSEDMYSRNKQNKNDRCHGPLKQSLGDKLKKILR